MRFLVFVVLTLLVLTAACGDSGAGETTMAAAAAPTATSTTPTTAITTTTTTTPETTTSTVGPWTTLPDPGLPPPPPILNLPGGPVAVETVCLVEGTTQGPISFSSEIRDLAAVFDQLGIEVVREGCEATLTLSLRGSRQFAWYHPGPQQCWTGYTIHSEASLVVGNRRVVMTADHVQNTLGSTSSCTEEGAQITHSFGNLFGYALWDMFEEAGRLYQGHLAYHPASEDELNVVISGMARDVEFLRSLAIFVAEVHDSSMENHAEILESLLPLTPYLIERLSHGSTARQLAQDTLGYITGQSFGNSQAAWWEWWEEQQG